MSTTVGMKRAPDISPSDDPPSSKSGKLVLDGVVVKKLSSFSWYRKQHSLEQPLSRDLGEKDLIGQKVAYEKKKDDQ